MGQGYMLCPGFYLCFLFSPPLFFALQSSVAWEPYQRSSYEHTERNVSQYTRYAYTFVHEIRNSLCWEICCYFNAQFRSLLRETPREDAGLSGLSNAHKIQANVSVFAGVCFFGLHILTWLWCTLFCVVPPFAKWLLAETISFGPSLSWPATSISGSRNIFENLIH